MLEKILCGIFEIGQTLRDANTNEEEIKKYIRKIWICS